MTWVADEAAMIADQFVTARRAASRLDGFPGQLPQDLDAAYRVQDQAIAVWGRKIIGWKVGRIVAPQDEILGADRLTGPIFDERRVAAGGVTDMPVFAKGFAAGEAEFLLRIGTAPDPAKTAYTIEEATSLIDAVFVGVEIASSPLATINEIGPVAVISDFGNNNGLLIGAEIPDWKSSGFEDWDVVLLIDGVEAGKGTARSFPSGAFGSARFLFELMAKRGIPLEPGQWISSGAVGGVHDARVDQIVEARFAALPPVRCRLVAAEAE